MANEFYVMDLLGTFVFAVSGFMAAREGKMDPFGAAVIAFVTAVGGGTIRDVLIGSVPVGWMNDPTYIYVILVAIVLTLFLKKYIIRINGTLFLFDAIGIGLFTILGLQKTLGMGLSSLVAVMMGTVSAVFGGVLRDIFINRVPLIFREEIYATACISGGLMFVLLRNLLLDEFLSSLIAMSLVSLLRILAVRFHWQLPTLS